MSESMTALIGLPMLATLVALGAWYWRAARRAAAWPAGPAACFAMGLLLTAAVTAGPIAAAAMERFSVHMVQHIVLMMVSTPLLVLGAPVMLAVRSGNPTTRTAIRRLLRNRAFLIITNPLVSWLMFATLLVGMHFTPAMSWLMDMGYFGSFLEQLLYITVAAAFYYTLLPGNPARNRARPAFRVLALFLMMIPETMTGFFLYTASLPSVPAFVMAADAAGQDPLLDQRFGGALMWSGAMIIDVCWIAVAVHEWFDGEAARTRRLDVRQAESQHE